MKIKKEQYIEIVRLYQTPVDDPKQTEGILYLVEDGKIIFDCNTLELPWLENKNRVSCIPTGTYTAVKRKTSRSQFKYEHLHIQNVKDRKWILIHRGNYNFNVLGCILVGKKGELTDINNDGYRDVTSSGPTLTKLLSLMKENEIEVSIRWRN